MFFCAFGTMRYFIDLINGDMANDNFTRIAVPLSIFLSFISSFSTILRVYILRMDKYSNLK